ncbi:uncharacterized protein LOC108603226 [Drosophila busckii]|uniref:uncharacterized protein LOC108603226 n=1 Tax=Drosophila busckii TaxID=30019 RepID=UPI001432AE3A|nr:uncharacterized protein LOC108603226 [Drosophila busckii]
MNRIASIAPSPAQCNLSSDKINFQTILTQRIFRNSCAHYDGMERKQQLPAEIETFKLLPDTVLTEVHTAKNNRESPKSFELFNRYKVNKLLNSEHVQQTCKANILIARKNKALGFSSAKSRVCKDKDDVRGIKNKRKLNVQFILLMNNRPKPKSECDVFKRLNKYAAKEELKQVPYIASNMHYRKLKLRKRLMLMLPKIHANTKIMPKHKQLQLTPNQSLTGFTLDCEKLLSSALRELQVDMLQLPKGLIMLLQEFVRYVLCQMIMPTLPSNASLLTSMPDSTTEVQCIALEQQLAKVQFAQKLSKPRFGKRIVLDLQILRWQLQPVLELKRDLQTNQVQVIKRVMFQFFVWFFLIILFY